MGQPVSHCPKSDPAHSHTLGVVLCSFCCISARSLRQEVLQNPEAVDYVISMDAAGRRSIRRAAADHDENIRVVTPPFLFYILYDNNLISRHEFCEACGKLLEREGWTGYNAVKAAWEGIPIDCSDVLDDHLLP